MISVQLSESLQATDHPALEDLNYLEQCAAITLQHCAQDMLEADMVVVVTDDDQLHALNLQYLGIDAPTDVLSFPSDDIDPDSGQRYLGDILISFPRASAQAQSGGHPVQDEMRLLAVHGVLHLLSYDHADEAGKAAMWAVQADILKACGSSIHSPVSE